MSDYYHDDPIEEAPAGRFPSKFIASAVVIFASVFFFQGTLASNITINSGRSLEFGQSVSATAACSGSENLTVTPSSSFVNASNGTGTHYLSTVSVSGIPSSCDGKDFIISFYDSATGSSALSIFTPPFESSKSVATVYNNAGYFDQGFQGTGTTVSGASGAFTVTFNSPEALSTNAMKVTLQSTEHKDWAIRSISNSIRSGHSCALLSSSAAKCWGYNANGQLGDGTITERRIPGDVSGLSSGVSAIATGNEHSCAVVIPGAVKCWGLNTSGQLGDGTITERRTPVDVSGLSSGVMAISAGTQHTCALLRTGAVRCWGAAGRTGDNTNTQRLTPVDVSGLSFGVIQISAGHTHTCALLSTGAVKCWGGGGRGGLGDGTGENRYAPVNVSGLSSGVIQISSGELHTCALLSTGAAKCWGWNDFRALGSSTSGDKYTPQDVVGISSGAISIAAGGSHTCVLLSTGAAKCWGYNSSGQLGNGTTTQSDTPVDVSGLSSAVTISTGGTSTCAFLSSGVAKCWGNGGNGRLGNGTSANQLTPGNITGIP